MTSYDAVPYPSLPIRRTHPCQLAAMGKLFALDAPDPRTCRVLEIGCAAGGNLLPMAADLPDATFLGIDASARQVADGQAAIRAAGLANVEIREQDLRQFPADAGRFDYIICHGVYSWVPRPLQDAIMAIGRHHLQPNGIFYLSYNTYPGWHLRGAVRDMMRFHVRRIDDERTKIVQARALLDFLVKSAGISGEAYQKLLHDEASILASQPDSYLYHEHLEDDNEPLYFHQFVERAEANGMQYLADADFSTMMPGNFGAEIGALLAGASRLAQEQYLDFLRNRTFRTSLLCQAENKLEVTIAPLRIAACEVAMEERVELPPLQLESDEPIVCRTPYETLTATKPTTKAALAVLNRQWPAPVAFGDLIVLTRDTIRQAGRSLPGDQEHRECLAQDLFTLLTRRLLRVSVGGPPCAGAGGPFPCATSLARWQATQTGGVTNRRHEHLKVSDLNRSLLARLDGRHDRAALVGVLREAVRRGEFEIRREGQLLTDLDDVTLGHIVERCLSDLAESALIAG